MESSIVRIELVDSAIDEERPSSAFIGASSTGSVASEPARKELTQRTSRNSRTTWMKASRMPTAKHADDQAVEAGIGDEGVRNLAVEDGGDEADDGQENEHRQEKDLRARQFVRIVVRDRRQDVRMPKDLKNAIRAAILICPASM